MIQKRPSNVTIELERMYRRMIPYGKLTTIKQIKHDLGLGLKEAKDYLDSLTSLEADPLIEIENTVDKISELQKELIELIDEAMPGLDNENKAMALASHEHLLKLVKIYKTGNKYGI